MAWIRAVVAPVLAALVGCVASACNGSIGDPSSSGQPGAGRGGTGAPEAASFDPAQTEPQLLPFWVRLNRVAAVAGLPVDDPAFEQLRNSHIDLGDYDYANGIQPN